MRTTLGFLALVADGANDNLTPGGGAVIMRYTVPAAIPSGGIRFDSGEKFAVGIRNAEALAWAHDGHLWAFVNGRDFLRPAGTEETFYLDQLGPLNEIKDPRVLVAVMKTFTQALGVRCSWCHITTDFAAPTPRKAVTAFMWDAFVAQLELVDGGAVYCDSCHHQSTIFLHRNVSEKTWLAKYMQTEYVDQLRRRDGKAHGCGTCHSKPFNPRFLPRLSDPPGYRAPVAEPGPQP